MKPEWTCEAEMTFWVTLASQVELCFTGRGRRPAAGGGRAAGRRLPPPESGGRRELAPNPADDELQASLEVPVHVGHVHQAACHGGHVGVAVRGQ